MAALTDISCEPVDLTKVLYLPEAASFAHISSGLPALDYRLAASDPVQRSFSSLSRERRKSNAYATTFDNCAFRYSVYRKYTGAGSVGTDQRTLRRQSSSLCRQRHESLCRNMVWYLSLDK